jgi:hypothetical protein
MDNNRSQEVKKGKRSAPARALDILLRTGHIGVSGVVLGGLVLGLPLENLIFWGRLAALSGLGLIASEVMHSRRWPYQGRGVMVMVHMALVGAAHLWSAAMVPLYWLALAAGSTGSHMSRQWRHWSFLHRRVMD